MAGTTYPTFLTGQRLTADLLTSGQPIHIVKTANTGRASATTQSADPELTIVVPAGRRYQLISMIAFDGASGTNMKGGYIVPTNGTLQFTDRAQPGGATGTSGSIVTNYQASATNGFIHGTIGTAGNNILTALIVGTFYSGDGGTLAFSWAQSSSSATAVTVYAGSHLTLIPVA